MTDSAAHRHAAFQIVVAVRGEVAMLDACETCHRGTVLVVPPMTRHQLLAAADVLTYFVEPHSAFADQLREYDGITSASQLHGLGEEGIRSSAVHASSALDPRLVAAMDTTMADWELSMPELAARVGLSPQRLRALARRELGMPLTRWRAWARLRRAAEALTDGQSLAEAAATASFADQAHLTRWMREMMGLTPSAVLPVLRAQSRRAV
ncbi:helix-turn-helix domain-containing protein [Nonomuraea sp. CA-143628]|uniref:helix-turn-helix domain-containing protein n=1 Tax=Nonomuraea sp. CA-143628 TaxID=3239997 RepID=UPI003D90C880